MKPLQSFVTLKWFISKSPIISYGIILWGVPTHSKIIFKIQKRIISIITNSGNEYSCRNLFTKLNILPSQYMFSLIMFVVKNKDQFKTTLMFVASIQELNMIYIFLQQTWQYSKTQRGILVPTFITIFLLPLNNYQMIFLNLKRPSKYFSIQTPFIHWKSITAGNRDLVSLPVHLPITYTTALTLKYDITSSTRAYSYKQSNKLYRMYLLYCQQWFPRANQCIVLFDG